MDKKGFFILDDGSKSTDAQNLPKKKAKKILKSVSDDEGKEEKPQKKLMKKAATS